MLSHQLGRCWQNCVEVLEVSGSSSLGHATTTGETKPDTQKGGLRGMG